MKNRVEILIVMTDEGHIEASTSSRNLVTNMGMIAIGTDLIKRVCSGEEKPTEVSPIIKPVGPRF